MEGVAAPDVRASQLTAALVESEKYRAEFGGLLELEPGSGPDPLERGKRWIEQEVDVTV
jgi:hypothetical protein